MIGVYVSLLLCLLQTQPGPEGHEKLPLQDILSNRENQDYQRKPQYRSRMKLFGKTFQRQSKLLQGQIKKLQINEGLETLHSLSSLSEHTLDEKPQREKDLRSNDVKKLEIILRKLLDNLGELKRAVPFEYRTHFDRCIEKIEELRNQFLTQLFGQTQHLFATPLAGTSVPAQALSALSSPPSLSLGRMWSYQSGDGFTDKEYLKIQMGQEIVRRVEVFLEIAERRLKEIDLRMNPDKPKEVKDTKKEKKQKEKKKNDDEDVEDSLEFYTYWDMVRAYHRAIEGIMVNIDEKEIHKLARPKEIRKALKKLCKKLPEFIPKLDPIQKAALEKQDEDLLAEIKQAQETSSLAEKGCLVALGGK